VKKTTSEQFCQDILKLDIKCAKAFGNTVIALSSYEGANHPVGLSESPLFHHQYSSIRDGISGIGSTPEETASTMASIRALAFPLIEATPEEWLLLQTDASGIQKAYSKCLEDRQYIKTNNNVIRFNKPISVGYPISLVNVGIAGTKWSIPLSIKRIPSNQSAIACAVEQVGDLLNDEGLTLSQQAIINTLDSGYGSAAYICPTYEHENLVNVVRFRYGKKIWTPNDLTTSPSPRGATSEEASKPKGTPKIYGDKYYLTDFTQQKTYHRKGVKYEVYQQSIFDKPEDEYIELSSRTARGRPLIIMVWRWNNLLIRSKDGHNMKDKFFDLVASKVIDEQTGELIFNKTMFTTINGQRKDEITTEQAFESYRHRYDIEPAIKFAKQKLLLEKYQTSDIQHFDNWLVVVMTSFWLLFTACKDATYKPKKWQQYKDVNKKAAQPDVLLTPSQTRQAAESFFLTFDNKPFLPKKSKKGKGREKGVKITPRPEYEVVKKTSFKPKTMLTIEKME